MLLAPEETLLLDLDDQLRRSACDRCRCQKLRCQRPPIGSSAVSRAPNAVLPICRRCQRAGAVCTTSFQQRPGRPRLSSSSDDQRPAGQNQQQSSRVNRRSRNSLVSANTSNDRTAAAGTNRRPCSDAAANPLASVPNSPQHHDPSFASLANSLNFSEQILNPIPLPGHSHMSSASDPDTLNLCINTGTLSQDDHDSGFWDLTTPDSLLQSWPQNVECPPAPSIIEKSASNATPSIFNETADNPNHEIATVAQRPNSERQRCENVSGPEAKDLYEKLTELSNALCKDVHHVIHRLQAALQPSSCLEDGIIQRIFRSSETLRSLLDKLRMKASNDRGLLTPTSLQLPHPTAGNITPVGSIGTGGSVGNEPLDHHLNMILALHIVTSYVCLNRIFKAILNRIFSAVSDGSVGQLPRLPGIEMEGLPCDNDHLRARLFAETCMHLATGIHKRLEALAAEGTMGFGFSRPIDMVLGRGFRDQKQEQADIDFRAIKDLCSQVSSAIEDKAW